MVENSPNSSNASKYLDNVPRENNFILSNGVVFSNLEGLYDAVKNSDQSVFYYHVTDNRNDFANWIKYCIKFDQLYDKILSIKQREIFLGMLAEEIALLKNHKILDTLQFFKEDANGLVNTTQKVSDNIIKEYNNSNKIINDNNSDNIYGNNADTRESNPVNTPIPKNELSDSSDNNLEALEFEQIFKSELDEIEREMLNTDL